MKKLIDVIYLVTSITGALLIALNVGSNVHGYLLFLISSCCGAWIALKSNVSKSILTVNIIFACINVLGLIRYGTA